MRRPRPAHRYFGETERYMAPIIFGNHSDRAGT
jgi:hypothetical protein